ncbi:hypothetical protein MMC30_002625 [Trapelia coarctata]|nr:hypothetical protein [Trapelia coarctata]
MLSDTYNLTVAECFNACDTWVATPANANGAACVASSWYQSVGDLGYCKLLYIINSPDLVGYQGSTSFRWTEYSLGAAAVHPPLPTSGSSFAGTGVGPAGTDSPTISIFESVSRSLTGPSSTSTSSPPITIVSAGSPGSETLRSGLGVGLGVGIPGVILLAGLAAFIWKWNVSKVERRAEVPEESSFEEESNKHHFYSQEPPGVESDSFAARLHPFISCGRRQEKKKVVAELRDHNSIHELGGHSPPELDSVCPPGELEGHRRQDSEEEEESHQPSYKRVNGV